MRFGQGWTQRVPPSDAYIGSIVIDLLKSRSPKRVLDVGCGNGVLARRLADNGFDVSGVDWDPTAVNLAAERVPEGRFSACKFSEAPPATDFDAAVSTEVIEHLFDPDELIQFASRALRPGGTFIITTPYHGYLKNFAIAIVGGWDKHFTSEMLAGHIKFFSRKTLTSVLERNGLVVESFKGAGRLPFLWKSMILVARKAE
jgi:2-polyprenyl-3-methyl-5-hydroxy-6-metoxy-1,4-benzoquinol methylase